MTNNSQLQKVKWDKIIITSYYKGRTNFLPVSYPSFEGIKHQIEYKGYKFIFDLTGEIKWIFNANVDWPDPLARIKRTIANEWILYLSYGYEDIYSLTGVYYIPVRENLDYIPILMESPFKSNWFKKSIECFYELITELSKYKKVNINPNISKIISKIIEVNKKVELRKKAHILHHLLNGTIPILPPDTVLVDYNVIPILISDGCLYNCKFCCLKTGNEWRQRSKGEIVRQIERIKEFLSEDIINYPAIFLGQNDALSSDPNLILDIARLGFENLLNNSIFKKKSLYLFASTTSLLNIPNWFFKELDNIGYKHIYINCGLESFEQDILNTIGKPITSQEVNEAYDFALNINRNNSCIEISLNFLISKGFPDIHLNTIYKKISAPSFKVPKGTIYISPMIGQAYTLRELKRIVFNLKTNSKWDIRLYLMQGL